MKNRWMNSWQISAFAWVLKAHAVNITMDGKRRAMDNIMVKRLWRAVKYEGIYLKEYLSVSQLNEGLRQYFAFYHQQRPHQGLGNRTPTEVYWGSLVELQAL